MRSVQRHIFRFLVAGLTLASSSPIASQSRIEFFRLAEDSPLATDGVSIFGVATDGRTLLVSSGSGADWQVFAKRPTPHRITGLAWERGALYLSDEEASGVYRLLLNPASGAPVGFGPNVEARGELVYQGPPLQRPRELAFAGGLLVADPGAGTVFRIDTRERTVYPFATGLPTGDIYVAADRRTVVVASPVAGEVRQPAAFAANAAVQRGPSSIPFSVWRTRQPDAPFADGGPRESTRVPQRRFPAIQRPQAPVLARGSLYLLDGTDGSVYVTFRQQARPMPVAPAMPVKRPMRLLALGESLMVLDGPRGVLDRWPLPVPTEFELGREAAKALDAFYLYLYETRALPVRRAAWRGSIDETLRQEGVLPGRGGLGPGLSLVACAMNAPLCTNGTWQPAAATATITTTIRVPDVPIESAVDLETLAVEELGDRTLGEEVDQRIVSPAFHDYRKERELWQLNASQLSALDAKRTRLPSKEPWGPYDEARMRQLRRRDFPPGFTLTVPVEKVRALVALPRPLLRDEERLSAIRLMSPGFNWNPLEEIEAKAQAMQPPAPPPPPPSPAPCDLPALKRLHEELLKTISFKLPSGVLGAVNVGVVERDTIDVQHPAFGPGYQALAFLPGQPTPPPAAAPPPPVCKVTMTDADHATAVAGLIASRAVALGLGGLAPNVQIVPLGARDDLVGEQLFAAFNRRNVRIFNLSLHYSEERPTNIRLKVNQLREALIVVSAGNDATEAKPVCESATPYPAYPVCEGNRKNVLVVAATNLDGSALIEKTATPPAPGSNWNEQLVHIAAPGTGYFAPGRDNSYVPVRGTSFATPLVTATAAILFAQGVQDPWLIKQRIIATADQRDNLLHKVYGAGLLNVERAVTEPKHAVLGTSPRKIVELEPGDITITWQTRSGGSRTLPLAYVRRLTRTLGGQSYRIVYYDDVTETLIVQDDVDPAVWPFKYRDVDPATGQPVGNPIDDKLGNYKDYVGPIIF